MVLATNNKFKVAEIAPTLRDQGLFVVPQYEIFSDEVIEDGESFLENALKKARFASLKTGLPAIGDDSGLEVEALNCKPGIFSARFAGEKASDEKNINKLLSLLEGVPYRHRKARYTCVMVYVQHHDDPVPLVGVGHWYGEVLSERRTGLGIGYDDIMWIPELVKAVSEIPNEIKNKISHRAQALQSIIKQIKS